MTDKTDIAALTRPVRDRYDWSNAVWRDCDQCGKQHTGTVTAEDGSQICAHCADQLYWSAWQVLAERALDQLEAERQRATGSEEELHKALHREKAAERKLLAAQGEIAALKAKMANPVVLSDCSFEAVSHMAHWYSEGECVAWVSGAEHVKKQILEAGFTVTEE